MKKILKFLALGIVASAVLLGLAGFNHLNSVYDVIPDEVYRSAQLDRNGIESAIKDKGIRSIINLRGSKPHKEWYKDEKEVSEALGVTHHDLRFAAEGLPRRNQVRKLAELIQTTEKPVLIHCKAGADRAGLGSVIALLLQDESKLDDVAEHVSMRYMAFDPESTGKLFFEQYSDWFSSKEAQHTKEQFLSWLDDDYIDYQGNLYYYIDTINGTVWTQGTQYADGYSYTVDRDTTDMLTVNGWAFDDKQGTLVSKVDVLIDSKKVGEVQYGQPRPDVAQYFDDSSITNSGWSTSVSLSSLPEGCHDLAIGIERLDGSRWVSPPEARVCM